MIYPNKETFYKHYINGKPLNQLKINGKALTSNYLKEGLEAKDSFCNSVGRLFDDACKYIHPSNYQYKETICEDATSLMITDETVEMITDKDNWLQLQKNVVLVLNGIMICFGICSVLMKCYYSLLRKL